MSASPLYEMEVVISLRLLPLCVMVGHLMLFLGTDLEASLLSFEKLDRASPDLWPEQRKLYSSSTRSSGKCGEAGLEPCGKSQCA